MRFTAEQAYSPHCLKAELVFLPDFQYFKTLLQFNSVIEIMNIYNLNSSTQGTTRVIPAKAGIFYKNKPYKKKIPAFAGMTGIRE